jgi:hypothetical protein
MMSQADAERRWRDEMDRLGIHLVRERFADRRPVIDIAPYPETAFIEKWLREKQAVAERREDARFKTIRLWTIIAAVAGTIAALASIIAAWPVVFPR